VAIVAVSVLERVCHLHRDRVWSKLRVFTVALAAQMIAHRESPRSRRQSRRRQPSQQSPDDVARLALALRCSRGLTLRDVVPGPLLDTVDHHQCSALT